MASRVSFSLHNPTTPSYPTTPARKRRLSNFHKLDPSLVDSTSTPVAQRTPFRPFNRQTPAKNPRRQSFAPKTFHSTPRASPSHTHHGHKTRQPHLSQDEIAQMYSSTIKLCQDNKINARNTWTLNLIDYMSMLVRGEQQSDTRPVSSHDYLDASANESGSTADTNFQLAGVTLDAGVKIYCSRVDSVHTNAFKVLGGLSRTGNESGSTSDEEDDSNHDTADAAKRRQRAAKRAGRSTLETNLANITSHKLETDLAVDPLFHKMSAAFDEGGAKGMLMNNLPIGTQGQILFDSSEPAEDELLEKSRQQPKNSESSDTALYDISQALSTESFEDDGGICSAFLRFYSVSTRFLENSDSVNGLSSDESAPSSRNRSESPSRADNNVLMENQDLGFDYDDGDLQNAGELGMFGAYDSAQDVSVAQDDDEVQVFETEDDSSRRFSTTSNMSIAIAAQRGGLDLVEAGMALQGNSSYAFFDTSTMSGWAGPQHWRFHTTTASTGTSSISGSKDKSKTTKRQRGKTARLLDFSSAAPTVDFAGEFEPGNTEESYQLSASVREGFSEKKVTLPEDFHYSTRSLAGLFLKPGTMVKPRSGSQDGGVEHMKNTDGEPWYAFENDCDNDSFSQPDDSHSCDHDGERNDMSDVNDVDLGMELVDEPIRVDKIDINYARVAKKIDVRQLKSGLWSNLCGETTKHGTETENIDSEAHPEEIPRPGDDVTCRDIRSGSSQRLQSVVSEMPSFVSRDSISDVSLPYVFICLLHLANEKTLTIAQTDDGSLTDLIITSE